MIVETAMSWLSDRAVMVLNSEEQLSMESSTYWMPTPKALTGMARLCHFDVLGGRWQPDIGRGAVLGRALPSRAPAPGANALVKAMHQVGLFDFGFQDLLSGADAAPASSIAYRGKGGEVTMHTAGYEPTFPFHAHRPDPKIAIGRRDWVVVPRDD